MELLRKPIEYLKPTSAKLPKSESNILTKKANDMETKKKRLKMTTLEQIKDKDIGGIGTDEREKYEFDLKMEVLGNMIKSIR